MARRKAIVWILVVVAILLGIPALAALVGWILPRDHVAQATITLKAPPDSVWHVVSDFASTPQWRKDISAVEMQSATVPIRFTEVSSDGRTPYEVVSQQPPSSQVIRVLDKGLPYGGLWAWALEPAGTGTRVTITEAGFVRNPIFRVMSRLFFPPTRTMSRYLESLAARFGETATPQILRAR